MGGDLSDGRKSPGTRSWLDTTCKKKEFQLECWRPKSPMRGEPKVMQMGRHLGFDILMTSSRHKVKREATDPPIECPVMINRPSITVNCKTSNGVKSVRKMPLFSLVNFPFIHKIYIYIYIYKLI